MHKCKILFRIQLLTIFSFVSIHAQQLPASARNDIDYLSSKILMGRGFTFDGNKKAADYLVRRYEEIGISEFIPGYLQSFKFPMNLIIPEPALEMNGIKLIPGKDFIPNPLSGTGKVFTHDSIMFVGNGLILPSKGINDFKGINIKDAVAVISDLLADSIKTDKSIPQEEISKNTRIKNAINSGAKAVLVSTQSLVYGTPKDRYNIPIAEISASIAPEEIVKIKLNIISKFDSVSSNNVIGYIPGSLYQDSTVIICAHYDHVSALSNDCYFPGANDNASGTAMILSLAEYFAVNPLKYRLVVAAFSGEEEGLWGSKYFSENPAIDLSKCKLLLNLDMVASGDKSIMAVGGNDFAEYFQLLSAVNDSLNLGEIKQRANSPNGDHYPIIQKGVKGFFLYANKGTQPYHSIYDVPETLNWQSFSDIYKLSKNFLEKL